MPVFPTFRLHLNVNRAAAIAVGRNDVDLGHISSKSHGECTAFVSFSRDKIFACSRNLLIA
jgi:predicted ribosome-associated RNA-binding protein Tma20